MRTTVLKTGTPTDSAPELLSTGADTPSGTACEGEFVSVSSQRDAERADLAQERRELVADPVSELNELTRIYERRGLEPQLAAEVARQLTDHDALGAHVRDELGLTEASRQGGGVVGADASGSDEPEPDGVGARHDCSFADLD